MIYTTDAIKIPGMIEKVDKIELPDGAIPLRIETMLEHEINENVTNSNMLSTDVFVGLYADNILYYSNKEMSFNEDWTKVVIEDEKGSTTYNIFFRIRYLMPK